MNADQLERLRVDRWHATYNAALTGILTGSERGSTWDRKAHAWAKSKANKAHGPLERKP